MKRGTFCWGLQDRMTLSSLDIAQLSRDSGARMRLAVRFRRDINDPDLKLLILEYLSIAAADLDDSAALTEGSVETLEWTMGFGSKFIPIVGGAVVAAGLLAGAGLIGGVVLFAGGLLALALAGGGRHLLKRTALKDRSGAARIRELVRTLSEPK